MAIPPPLGAAPPECDVCISLRRRFCVYVQTLSGSQHWIEARLRRRDFLAGGAATLAAGPTPAELSSWTLARDGDRYVVRLHGTSLICDCTGADSQRELPPMPAEAALIVAGRHPLAWRLATAHQPNPLTLRIALAALD